MQGCCIYVALLKIEPGTPLILPLQPAILSQIRTTKGAGFMAAVTLPTHYRNVFAELGYAQAEIDARIAKLPSRGLPCGICNKIGCPA